MHWVSSFISIYLQATYFVDKNLHSQLIGDCRFPFYNNFYRLYTLNLERSVPEVRTKPSPLFMYTQTEITLCVARSTHGNQESIQNDLL